MTLYCAVSPVSFYNTAVHAVIPDDAVEIADDYYGTLLAGLSKGQLVEMNADGNPVLVDPPPAPPPSSDLLCAYIDAAADAARLKVVGDPLRATEYERAAAEAQAFKDAGYPADSVPRTVAAWAINGRTAQESADSILAEAAAYAEALYCLRETRLSAKELVRQAMTAGNTAEAEDIAAEAIATIEAMIAGVGNSPA